MKLGLSGMIPAPPPVWRNEAIPAPSPVDLADVHALLVQLLRHAEAIERELTALRIWATKTGA